MDSIRRIARKDTGPQKLCRQFTHNWPDGQIRQRPRDGQSAGHLGRIAARLRKMGIEPIAF